MKFSTLSLFHIYSISFIVLDLQRCLRMQYAYKNTFYPLRDRRKASGVFSIGNRFSLNSVRLFSSYSSRKKKQ